MFLTAASLLRRFKSQSIIKAEYFLDKAILLIFFINHSIDYWVAGGVFFGSSNDNCCHALQIFFK